MKSTTPATPNPTLVWIPFTTTETSKCPVPPNTLVYVQLRDEPDTIEAESEANNASDLHWSSHTGNNPWDIVAYAIAETNHHPMTLSKREALEIQARDLEQWKTLLKPEIHAELVKRVTHYNDRITQPRDIIRGCGVTEIILNWHNPNWNRQLVFMSLA